MKKLLLATVAVAVSVAVASVAVRRRLGPDAPTAPPGSWDLADEVEGT